MDCLCQTPEDPSSEETREKYEEERDKRAKVGENIYSDVLTLQMFCSSQCNVSNSIIILNGTFATGSAP